MPRRPANSIDRFLASVRNNKLVTIAITLGVAVIALANFTDALTKLGNFVGLHIGKEIDATEAKTKIRRSIRGIDKMSPGDAQKALTVLEGIVASANTSDVKQTALAELVTFISEPTTPSDRVRSIRKAVMDSIIRINSRDLAALFGGDELNGVDLYGMDLSKTNLRGVNLRSVLRLRRTLKMRSLMEPTSIMRLYAMQNSLEHRSSGQISIAPIGLTAPGLQWPNSRVPRRKLLCCAQRLIQK